MVSRRKTLSWLPLLAVEVLNRTSSLEAHLGCIAGGLHCALLLHVLLQKQWLCCCGGDDDDDDGGGDINKKEAQQKLQRLLKIPKPFVTVWPKYEYRTT